MLVKVQAAFRGAVDIASKIFVCLLLVLGYIVALVFIAFVGVEERPAACEITTDQQGVEI